MSKSKPAPKAAPVSAEPRQPFMSREEALAAGKALRAQVPLALHATWRPAPREWNMRLAVSFALAARNNNHADTTEAAIRCARAYRKGLRDFSKKHPLVTLYTR